MEDVSVFPAPAIRLDKINSVCKELHQEVKDRVLHWMNKGKK